MERNSWARIMLLLMGLWLCDLASGQQSDVVTEISREEFNSTNTVLEYFEQIALEDSEIIYARKCKEAILLVLKTSDNRLIATARSLNGLDVLWTLKRPGAKGLSGRIPFIGRAISRATAKRFRDDGSIMELKTYVYNEGYVYQPGKNESVLILRCWQQTRVPERNGIVLIADIETDELAEIEIEWSSLLKMGKKQKNGGAHKP